MSPEHRKSHDTHTILDVKSLVPRIIDGDELAAETLDRHLRPLLKSYYSRRASIDAAEDLTQETILGVILGLPKFNISNQNEPDYSLRFRKWCFGIAKHTLIHEYERRTQEQKINQSFVGNVDVYEDPPSEKETLAKEQELENLIPKLKDKLTEILTPEQLEIALLKLEGKDLHEVMNTLGINKSVYNHRVVEMRARCEEQLIFPAGFKKIEKPSFLEAARRGTLQTVRFMGRYYTTTYWEKQYEPKKRTLSYKDAPSIEYRRLSEFTKTTAEYHKLLKAVRSGKLQGKKIGRFWFVKETDHTTYKDQTIEPEEYVKPIQEDMGFNSWLQILAKKSKINTIRLAALLGASRETTRNWLNGNSVPNERNTQKLLDILLPTEEEKIKIMNVYWQLPVRRRRGH